MRKNVKLLGLLLISVLLSGCVKLNVNMSINSDKSMDLDMIMAYSKQIQQYVGEGDTSFSGIEESSEYGFEVKDYEDDSYFGKQVTKHFNNIDEISSESDVTANISASKEMKNLFTVKKGFLKNVYSAKFKSEDANDINEKSEDYKKMGDEYKDMLNVLDLKYTINLPSKAISSNATSVENNGKRLIWNLKDFKDGTMNFEFEFYNMNNVLMLGGIILLVIIIIIAVIIFIKKSNNKKQGNEVLNVDTINNSVQEKTETLDVDINDNQEVVQQENNDDEIQIDENN